MCGRFSLSLPAKSIAEFFGNLSFTDVEPRYNIAPTQPVLTLFCDPQDGRRYACPFHWGLVPSWVKDPKMGARLTNARCETLAEKPSFRGAFRYRRCLVPADGFYEWQTTPGGKQPFFIRLIDAPLLFFAGLWEHWSGPDGSEIRSVTIITTEANGDMRPLHHRMPVILDRPDWDLWLNPEVRLGKEVQHLMVPLAEGRLEHFPVNTYVNKTGNEGPRCREPLPPQPHSGQMELF